MGVGMRTFYDKLTIVATAILLCVVVILTLNSNFKKSKPDNSPQEYTVTFYQDDKETVLKEGKVKKDEKAEAENPTKASTQLLSYTFLNWTFENGEDATEALSKVTTNLKVYANYAESIRKYSVIFLQPDKTNITTQTVDAGQSCNLNFVFDSPQDGKLQYQFLGWVFENGEDASERLLNVLEDLTVYAKYKTTQKTYSLSFDSPYILVKHGEGTFFSKESASQIKMREGDLITIQCNVPEGYSKIVINVSGANPVDEDLGIYRVVSNVEILAALVK